MKFLCWLFILLIGYALPANAVNSDATSIPPSLFLTPAEKIIQASSNEMNTALQALLYYAPNDWQLWLNGQLVTPATAATAVPDRVILSVQQGQIKIRQSMGSMSRVYSLQPQQIYDWANNAVAPMR